MGSLIYSCFNHFLQSFFARCRNWEEQQFKHLSTLNLYCSKMQTLLIALIWVYFFDRSYRFFPILGYRTLWQSALFHRYCACQLFLYYKSSPAWEWSQRECHLLCSSSRHRLFLWGSTVLSLRQSLGGTFSAAGHVWTIGSCGAGIFRSVIYLKCTAGTCSLCCMRAGCIVKIEVSIGLFWR